VAKGRDASRRLELLRAVAAKGERLLVALYQNPDPDALGSALALRRLVCRKRESCTIAYTGEIGRPENAAMIRFLRIPVVPFEEHMLQSHDLHAIVDAQPSFFKEHAILRDLRFNIVIDHHPRQKGYGADFVDVRPSYGSTSTIMTEYLRQSRVRVTATLATALYYGLETDTASLQRIATDADISAFRYLRSRVNMQIIRAVEQSHFPLNMLDHFGAAIVRKRVTGEIIYSHLGGVEVADIPAQVADFFISVYEIGWAIVSAVVGEMLVVVLRSDGYKKDAGRLASAAYGEVGSAGGHRTMARAEIPLSALQQTKPGPPGESLEKYVLQALAKHLRPMRRLRPR
jgi:nanoRNase/pAp phosphatase (c-di-AMP/oligoRNAs hydrolase)